jgi:hypothetical protein
MNAERLHVIALAVRDDLVETRVEKTLGGLVSALQNQVSQPQGPEHQQQVSTHLAALYKVLPTARSNDFSPAWKQVVKELGAEHLLGADLADQIRAVFERNAITPSVALEQLRQLQQQLIKFKQALDQVIAGFDYLKIGAEQLMAGECELGVLIPRSSVDNRLDEFADELTTLDQILGDFAEVATGSRPGFGIRSISSSDLSVYLDSAPATAACLAVAVERLVSFYKQLLEIRKLRLELKSQGVPDKKLKGITDHADSLMSDGIEALVTDLINQYYRNDDEGRRHELTVALRFALTKIARRIDKGYSIEIRVEPVPQSKDQEGVPDTASESAKHVATIRSAYKGLRFIKLEGSPILGLAEGNTAEVKPKRREGKGREKWRGQMKAAPRRDLGESDQ